MCRTRWRNYLVTGRVNLQLRLRPHRRWEGTNILPTIPVRHRLGLPILLSPYCDQDYFQARGAVGVLSDGMSSRLFTEVREKRGLCYSVYATYHSLRDEGLVSSVTRGTSTERAQETLDVILCELRRLTDGIQENELQRLKARVKSALIMQQESSMARSGAIAGDWYHLKRVRPLVELQQIVDDLSCQSVGDYLSHTCSSKYDCRDVRRRALWRYPMQFCRDELDNGLEVIAECNPAAYSMGLAFFVRTGSRDEDAELSGVSHFLEHMAFKGTPTRTAADVNRELDEIGSQSNAFTSEEQDRLLRGRAAGIPGAGPRVASRYHAPVTPRR